MEQRLSVLDRLTKGVTASEIRAELVAIRNEKERLELAEQVLGSLLDLVPADEAPRAVLAPEATKASDDSAESISDSSPLPAPRSNREAILEIMATDAGRSWNAPTVRSLLEERGVEITPENLRVTLRRMAKRGELDKPAQGQFRLPRNGGESSSARASLRGLPAARGRASRNPSLMDGEAE